MSAPIRIPTTPPATPDLEMFRGEPFDTLIKYIEHTSLINIRPAAGNRAIEISDPELRRAVETIVKQWVVLPW